MITLYGIKNCDSVRKARRWLDQHGIDYRFHDLREEAPGKSQIEEWIDELGWETLLNRRSTTWKALPQAERDAMNRERAASAVLQQPTLIKRPLLDTGHERFTGFSAEHYARIFNRHTL